MPIASIALPLAAMTGFLAQAPAPVVTSSGPAAACGPVEEASAVCLAVFNTTGNATVARVAQTVLVLPFRIALILAVALVVQRLLRRTIGRFVRAMNGERARTGADQARSGPAAQAGEPPPRALFGGGHGPSLRRAQRAETLGALLRSVSGVVIWSVATLMAMAELGLNLGPLIAGAGILGVAVGFGAQHLVRDFVSGIFMLAEDQYGVGDVIDAGPATGRVESVSLRTTRLRDVDGTVWHMPNGEITRVGNKSQQWARAVLDVEVAYDTDIPSASEVIKATADRMWNDDNGAGLMIEEPEVWGVENLGADGIAIRLVVKTAPNEQLGVARELRARIKHAFDEAGIEIPSAPRTVWHRVDDGATALVPVGRPAAGTDR